MVAVSNQKAAPSIEFSTAKGNYVREQEVEDTMLDLLQPLQKDQKNKMHLPQLRQLGVVLSMKLSKNNLLVINFHLLSPMRARVLWQKIHQE